MTPETDVWMTPKEATAASTFYRALEQQCAERNLPPSPLLTLRIRGIYVYFTLLRRLEASFLTEPPKPLDKHHTALILAAARMHENLRRAIAEFERILRPPTHKNAPAPLLDAGAPPVPEIPNPAPEHDEPQIAPNAPENPSLAAGPASTATPKPATTSTKSLPPPPTISRHLRNIPWQPPSKRR